MNFLVDVLFVLSESPVPGDEPPVSSSTVTVIIPSVPTVGPAVSVKPILMLLLAGIATAWVEVTLKNPHPLSDIVQFELLTAVDPDVVIVGGITKVKFAALDIRNVTGPVVGFTELLATWTNPDLTCVGRNVVFNGDGIVGVRSGRGRLVTTVMVAVVGVVNVPVQPNASVTLTNVYVYCPFTALDCGTVVTVLVPVVVIVWLGPAPPPFVFIL